MAAPWDDADPPGVGEEAGRRRGEAALGGHGSAPERRRCGVVVGRVQLCGIGALGVPRDPKPGTHADGPVPRPKTSAYWSPRPTNQCLLVAQSKNQCLLVAQPEDPAGFCFSLEVGPKPGAHQPTPKPFPQRCCAALRDAKPCVIFPKTGFFPGKKTPPLRAKQAAAHQVLPPLEELPAPAGLTLAPPPPPPPPSTSGQFWAKNEQFSHFHGARCEPCHHAGALPWQNPAPRKAQGVAQ